MCLGVGCMRSFTHRGTAVLELRIKPQHLAAAVSDHRLLMRPIPAPIPGRRAIILSVFSDRRPGISI